MPRFKCYFLILARKKIMYNLNYGNSIPMVVSNVWGWGGESTKRNLFDPMRSSAQTIWKFQLEVSFFFIGKMFHRREIRIEQEASLVQGFDAVQIKKMWYSGNMTMTAIFVAVGIRNLVHY